MTLPTHEQLDLADRLGSIFFPHATSRQRKAIARKQRFVHYTSAPAGLQIIETKRLWMRNATCMADYREVQYGYEMLLDFFRDEANRRSFFDAIDGCVPNAGRDALTLFDRWWGNT